MHITITDNNGKTVVDLESQAIILSAFNEDIGNPQIFSSLNGRIGEIAAVIYGTIDLAQKVFDHDSRIRESIEFISELDPEDRKVVPVKEMKQ